jgi:hypothetical protein
MAVVRGRAETILLFAADATTFLSLFKKWSIHSADSVSPS